MAHTHPKNIQVPPGSGVPHLHVNRPLERVFMCQYLRFKILFVDLLLKQQERQFIDWKKVVLKAGDGGNGCVHFRRKK